MRYIVLDTNCLLQALPSNSPFHKIWTEVVDGSICLCVNTDILEEYEEVLARKTTPEIARNIVDAIANLSTTIFQNTYVHFELLPADSDDNKFVDCAVASDAEYIVTNDKHFNPLKEIPWPKVEIIKIAEFIKLI
jgi:putative PIN family toxin of toxin-antitoxin system